MNAYPVPINTSITIYSVPRLEAAVPSTNTLLARVTGTEPGQYVVLYREGGIGGDEGGGRGRVTE